MRISLVPLFAAILIELPLYLIAQEPFEFREPAVKNPPRQSKANMDLYLELQNPLKIIGSKRTLWRRGNKEQISVGRKAASGVPVRSSARSVKNPAFHDPFRFLSASHQ
jgi:hypothetical protein